ncbi:ABC transporter permease [Prauserella marina]|uniref:Autoinducer 2 import system permease protein LsrD n=1 Tax=Prauserella marina TaxID=530584 RepID=A0A222VP15_9PSEU|nr:ABC transporter permease [Prauserella marina]ASR35624.1 ABC transporter permease [Prauserella marina]PWV84512.1 monosaccharide ABC transporter membrane protein (CUT2 family) [Prauserella marina]SDC20526.1 ribose transport system permease protein [Prauserella marina]
MSEATTTTSRRIKLADGTGPVLAVLAVLLIALAFVGPAYSEPSGYLALLKRAAPLMILAIGQYFVIVSGGFDLSVGSLVTAEVVIAARLLDGDEAATLWVIPLLLCTGALVGLVNGLITTRLLVPSFIVTLGMLLVLDGAVFLWTGGSPRGALTEAFRVVGREGFEVPLLGQLPWSVLVLAALVVAAVVFMRRGTGRMLVAIGDNETSVRLGGGKVERLRTLAFVLSGVSAAIAAILLGGFAGVSAQVGDGLEFRVITAVVLGGVVLGGGRGSVVAAMAGALTLEALFSLLNLLGVAGGLESAVQGVIIIAAVAYAAAGRISFRTRRST